MCEFPQEYFIIITFEIQTGKNTIWNLLLKKQIKAFYNQNGLALKRILDQTEAIKKEFLVFEGDKVHINTHTGKPDLLEGKSEEEMNKKWQELMSREVNMLV